MVDARQQLQRVRESALVEWVSRYGCRALSFTGVQLALVLLVHAFLWDSLFRYCQLPPVVYFQPVLLVEAAKLWQLTLLLLVGVAIGALCRERLSWDRIDPRRRTRWFVFLVAGTLGWSFATADVNLFFNQTHVFDRLTLLGLWLLMLVHPAFIHPFLLLLMMLATQLHVPLQEGNWHWPDKRLPLDLLIVFDAFLLFKAVSGKHTLRHLFPTLALVITGASYSQAAINKSKIGPELYTWLTDNRVSNLFVSAHVNGNWMGEWSSEQVVATAQAMRHVDLLSGLFTFAVELSGLLLLLHWRSTRVLLPLLVALHFGILISSGIFFWKWMVVDLGLLAYLAVLRRDDAQGESTPGWAPAFAPRLGLTAALVMLLAPYYLHAVPFAWRDTKYINFVYLRGISESGNSYALTGRFFAPYDVIFTQARFHYIHPHPVLTGTYGVAFDSELAEALENADVSELSQVRAQYGRAWFDHREAQKFNDFVQRFVANAQRRKDDEFWLSRLGPPYHFRSTQPPDRYRFQEPLVRVDVFTADYYYTGEAIVPLENRRVMMIEVQ